MDDLISEFIHETAESLAVLDTELVKLERNPGDREILETIYRLVHTIKGTCGFLDLARLETVAEAVEDTLAKVHDGEVTMTQPIGFALLEALSSIRSIVSHLAESGCEPEGDDKELIARLKRATKDEAPVAAKKAVPVPKAAKPIEKPVELAEPNIAAPLPPFEMNHPPLATITPKEETISTQAKQSAIRHGLEVEGPKHYPVSRSMLEKLAHALENLIHARNQLRAGNTSLSPLSRLNAATCALKEVLHTAEQETAQPSPVKIMSVLFAYAAGQMLALPQRYILEVVDLFADKDVRVETINRTEVLIKGKRIIPLVKLRSLLKLSEFPSMREEQVIVMRVGQAEFGLVTERLGELMEVVLEKLPRVMQPLGLYKGAALMNDEQLVMVMDAAGMARAIGFRHVEDIAPQLALPRLPHAAMQGFVIFRAWTSVPKALLVDQVARITDVTKRPDNMKVATLPGTEIPASGSYELVVLENGNESVAIAVEKVIDVLHAPLEVKPNTANPAYLGTVDFGGMTAELVNVENIVAQRRLEAA